MSSLRQSLAGLLTVLFPPRCGACNVALVSLSTYGLCELCHEVLEPNLGPRCGRCDLPGHWPHRDGGPRCTGCQTAPPDFDTLRAPFLYGGPLARMVSATKFSGREDLAASQAHLIWTDAAARHLIEGADTIVPVPLGRRRRRQRGFNQSAILARVLARLAGRPVNHLLSRNRNTQPQSELGMQERAKNIAGAFSLKRPGSGRVLLVDDVVTSGQTIREASKCLANGGFSVSLIALARTEDLSALSVDRSGPSPALSPAK